MKKTQYGEFKFGKSPARPAVKGYAYGGATPAPAVDPMAARKPAPKPTPTPAPMSAAAKLAAENKAVIDKANLNPNRQGSPLLIEKDAMKAALDKNLAIRQATDARLKAEAKANTVPASQNPYAPIQRMMDAVQARSTTPVKRAKGGEARAATKKELSYLTKAKAPKEVMMHEKAEMRGKVGDTKPMVKKELSVLRTAGAPSKMMQEEKKEMMSPLMAKAGGKIGLWDNIHAKRKRIESGSGERMRKPGSKGAPTAKDLRVSAKKMEEGGKADMSQDKTMIKKAMKQHDQQEHKGGKGTVLKLRKGGVPAYNKSPKIC